MKSWNGITKLTKKDSIENEIKLLDNSIRDNEGYIGYYIKMIKHHTKSKKGFEAENVESKEKLKYLKLKLKSL